ncbi:unnamed protein product, partial [Arctia plantaginis]
TPSPSSVVPPRISAKAKADICTHGPIKVQTAKSSESTKDLSIQATSSATLSFNDSPGIRDVPRADAIGLKSPNASLSDLTSVCDTPRKGCEKICFNAAFLLAIRIQICT